jgi:hypothetical protein
MCCSCERDGERKKKIRGCKVVAPTKNTEQAQSKYVRDFIGVNYKACGVKDASSKLTNMCPS